MHKIKGLTTKLSPEVFIGFKSKMEKKGWREECPTPTSWRMTKGNWFCNMNFWTSDVVFFNRGQK